MYKIIKTPDALNSFVEEFKDLLHQTCRIKSDKKIIRDNGVSLRVPEYVEEFEKCGHNDRNNSPR
jgi:hypothetical protein